MLFGFAWPHWLKPNTPETSNLLKQENTKMVLGSLLLLLLFHKNKPIY